MDIVNNGLINAAKYFAKVESKDYLKFLSILIFLSIFKRSLVLKKFCMEI